MKFSRVRSEQQNSYLTKVLYDKYWFAVLPIHTSGILSYLYKYSKQGMGYSSIKNHLLGNGVDKIIHNTKNKYQYSALKKELLEKNNCTYPETYNESINMLIDFKIINIQDDQVVFLDKIDDIFTYFEYIPKEFISEIHYYKLIKSNYSLLKHIFNTTNSKGKCSICINELIDNFNISTFTLNNIIRFLNLYLVQPIENITGFESICLEFRLSDRFYELKNSFAFIEGGD